MNNSKIEEWIENLRSTDIDGCITGSTLAALDNGMDMSTWDELPDIDIFCYSPSEMIHAIDVMELGLSLKPGKYDAKADRAERWKRDMCIAEGMNKKSNLSTLSFTTPQRDIAINVSCRGFLNSMVKVITNFDMSIIMIGHDIKTGVDLDLREINGQSKLIAQPNCLRKVTGGNWDVAHWVRQFDRVIKYHSRGFDCRPMADFYLKMLDDRLEEGNIFTTDKSEAYWQQYKQEFEDYRARIAKWIEGHKDE